MMKLFGKMYAGMLTVIAVLILIAAPVCGFFAGKYNLLSVYGINMPANLSATVNGIIVAAAAFVVTFFFEALLFGHEAQIIELRRKVEKIDKKTN